MPSERFEPIRRYRWTNEEFREKKRQYQAKYGSTIYVPGFEDIVHLRRFTPMTDEEKRAWSSRRYEDIPEGRREDIRREKARKKEKFLAMLSSPSPDIAQNAGTVLTALDDAQDAVSTLASIATIGAKVLGKSATRALAGPIGWAWAASDLLNMINPASRLSKWWRTDESGRAAKRAKDRFTENNPSTKKGKARTAKKIRNFKPTSANICEALQTTDQLFGLGISLGPVVGFAQDLAFGGWKTQLGEYVDIKFTPRARNEWKNAALGVLNTNWIFGLVAKGFLLKDEIDHRIAHHFATQCLYEDINISSPLDMYTATKHVILHAPEPKDILSLEVIEETTGNDHRIGIPGIQGFKRARYEEIEEIIMSQAKDRHETFAKTYCHDASAMLASECESMSALNMLSSIEGEEEIRTDYVVQSKVIHKIYNNGWLYPPEITPTQALRFNTLIDECEEHNFNPSSDEIQMLAREACGFQFVQAPELSGW